MKLKLKTLNRTTFTVDAEPSEKVIDLKKKIHEVQGYDVERQNLIYKGKILADDLSVESCGFTEKDFIVVMEMKAKKKAPEEPTPAVPTPAAAPAPVEKKSVEEAKPAAAPQPETTPATTSVPTTTTAPATSETAPAAAAATTTSASDDNANIMDASGSSFVTGSAYESAVKNLLEMGFERENIVKAMRASFNNPDRAAEYLISGIPEHLQMPQQPAEAADATAPATGAAQPTAPTTTPATTNPAATTEGAPVNLFEAAAAAAAGGNHSATAPAGQNELSFLRSNPQFQRIRELIQANPQLIQPILQQLGQANPELFEAISHNQDAFIRLLEEGMNEGAEGAEGAAHPPGAIPIQITPEENEAISRLEALGFDRSLAVEAYLACDKNEELAANYLFNTQNENWD